MLYTYKCRKELGNTLQNTSCRNQHNTHANANLKKERDFKNDKRQ